MFKCSTVSAVYLPLFLSIVPCSQPFIRCDLYVHFLSCLPLFLVHSIPLFLHYTFHYLSYLSIVPCSLFPSVPCSYPSAIYTSHHSLFTLPPFLVPTVPPLPFPRSLIHTSSVPYSCDSAIPSLYVPSLSSVLLFIPVHHVPFRRSPFTLFRQSDLRPLSISRFVPRASRSPRQHTPSLPCVYPPPVTKNKLQRFKIRLDFTSDADQTISSFFFPFGGPLTFTADKSVPFSLLINSLFVNSRDLTPKALANSKRDAINCY